MDGGTMLDIDELIDGQRIGLAAIAVAVLALMVMISDGFDVAAMGYIAPEILKEWKLPVTSMVPVFFGGHHRPDDRRPAGWDAWGQVREKTDDSLQPPGYERVHAADHRG